MFLWTLAHVHAHQDGKAEETGVPKDELRKLMHKCPLADHSSVSDVASQAMSLHSAQIKNIDMPHNKECSSHSSHALTVERKDIWPATACKGSVQWPILWTQKRNHWTTQWNREIECSR
jgi:hypothetical protein